MSLRPLTLSLAALALTGCGRDEPLLFASAIEVTHYESQPMVVDVRVQTTGAAFVEVDVVEDPETRAVSAVGGGGDTTLRLRGLSPGSAHTLHVRVRAAGGQSSSVETRIETPPALPGFEPSFTVTGIPSFPYALFDMSVSPPMTDGGLYAVDGDGRTRFYLPTPSTLEGPDVVAKVPAGVKLLDDGRLLYVQDHHVRIVDELGTVPTDIDAFDVGVDGFHHDVIPLPNGNLLVLGYEFRDVTYASDGQTRHVAGDCIVELTPEGERAWTWSSFEHLDPQRVRDGFLSPFPVINPRTGQHAADWTHGNGIVHRASDDSILYSARHQDWIVKISRATGEVLWRLGDEGDFSLSAGSWFHHQHSPEWQRDGSLLLYDNGNGNPDLALPEQRTRPVRYVLDELGRSATLVWEDSAEKYLAIVAGDADALSNGHVVVLDSSLPMPSGASFLDMFSRIREVDPSDGQWLFTLQSPDERFIYRAPPVTRLPGAVRE